MQIALNSTSLASEPKGGLAALKNGNSAGPSGRVLESTSPRLNSGPARLAGRTVLLTTTINVPRVLERYRELDRDAQIIVAGDRKTPHADVRQFVSSLGNALYLSDEDQTKLGYESSEIIGWNKIMRRNIALLEAIRQKPDVIISIDDDNLPLGDEYFHDMRRILGRPYSGIMASCPDNWFNIGALLSPAVWHRGFSYEHRQPPTPFRLQPINGKRVGVAAGLWLGDPDIDAMERITNQPTVLQMSDVLCGGVVVDSSHYSPFNSQNTGYLAELAPLMMVWVGVGRYDDIWASYVAERVMRDTGHVVHYGKPYVWQERNPQNRWKNLKDEVLGMEQTPQFCRDLDAMDLGNGDVLDKLARLYEQLQGKDYLPPVALELGRAWVSDVEKALNVQSGNGSHRPHHSAAHSNGAVLPRLAGESHSPAQEVPSLNGTRKMKSASFASIVDRAKAVDTLERIHRVYSGMEYSPAEPPNNYRNAKAIAATGSCNSKQVLAALFELVAPRNYLEIGTRRGHSLCVAISSTPEPVDVYSFDMWIPDYGGEANPGPDLVWAELGKLDFKGTFNVAVGDSKKTVPEFFAYPSNPQLFDVIYVDGDHSDEGALADLENTVTHLAPGGFLLFDDITHPQHLTLLKVWKDFVAAHPELEDLVETRYGYGWSLARRRTAGSVAAEIGASPKKVYSRMNSTPEGWSGPVRLPGARE